MTLLRLALMLALLISPLSCRNSKRLQNQEEITIVFKHGKLFGDPEPVHRLLQRFEALHPGVRVKDETLPATTDEQHQFYVINLEGNSSAFDVFGMDVIWVPEFARAGWLRDLSRLIPAHERSEFFAGPMEAVTYDNSIFAVPWYIDAGVLYYRKDLLQRYGFAPPQTWNELIAAAAKIQQQEPGLYGFLWQGKQYEGLICNATEYIWSNGGEIFRGSEVAIDEPSNVEALRLMKDLIYRYKVTPELVTTAEEDTTRRIFGSGKSIFLRNWPYAWNLFEKDGSPVQGKTGVTLLPAFPGHASASTLGGWQLGINKNSRHPEVAEKFIRFMTSFEAQKELAIQIGYKPTRIALYEDAELKARQPFIAGLISILRSARPRPVTPYYMMISQVLQPEVSAVISGIKEPEEALKSSKKQMEFIVGVRSLPQVSSFLFFIPE